MSKPVPVPRPSAGSEASPAITPVRASDTGAANRAAIQTWTGKAIAEQIHSKTLSEAYRHWLYHRASRQPCLRDMYTKSLNMFGDILLSVKLANEHVVVSQSDSYVRNLGQDLRGTRMSELKFATANSLRDIYDDCLGNRRPVYARYISSLSNQHAYWEAMILPLAADERSEPVFTMSFVAMLSEKIDVLQILYDRSPVGIIAAVPIMDGQNRTDDARILTMNDKAHRMLKLDPAGNPMHTVGELIRYQGSSLGWTGIKTSAEGQATRIDYRDPAGKMFSMMIELINQLVLISIAENGQPDVKTTSRFARLLGLG